MELTDIRPGGVSTASASSEMLLAVLDQSPDCIKILSPNGRVDYMNRNGQCAMEIDDFCAIAGQEWSSLWPEENRHLITSGLASASSGQTVRFQAGCPTAKGTMKWWDVTLRKFDTAGELGGFISISRDITDLILAQEAADAVAAEMRHRLRNAYHVVGILMSAFARGDAEKERFTNDMLGRLTALAAAQTMQQEETGLCGLPDLVKAIVSPYETPTCSIRLTDLPDVELRQAEIDALAMVLGELCVNSTKHGALNAGGGVTLSGDYDGQYLSIRWSENSNCPVKATSRPAGKGMQLMRRVMAARKGTFETRWHETGVIATLRFIRLI